MKCLTDKQITDRQIKGITNDVPVRLAVLNLEGKLIGYKIDSVWSLSENEGRYKVHPLEDSKPEGHLAENLLYFFNKLYENPNLGWVSTQKNGVILSVEDVSNNNFGKELLRYRIVKGDNEYKIKTE